MVTENTVKLEKNKPFEEIGEKWYIQFLAGFPPERWCNPYEEYGWFFMGEPYTHDWDTGEAYHYLCFKYDGRYYAGLRSIEMKQIDIMHEIFKFCQDLGKGQN